MALEPPSSNEPGGDLSKDDILDILKDETPDDNKDDKDDKTPLEATDEDEDEDEDSDEVDDEEEDDEDAIGDEEEDKELVLEDKDANTFPRKKEILKEFPTLFKKFPGIEHSIYRDRQFSEVFATPEDAKEASEKAEVLDEYSNDLSRGSMERMLKNIKDNDESAFL